MSNSPDPDDFDFLLSQTGETSSRVYKKSAHYKDAASALGKRVRQVRKEYGWTLEYAARQMRIDLKHLQKIEAGNLNVTLVTLVRIARGFRVPIDMLFGDGPVTPAYVAAAHADVFDFVKKKLER